MSTPRKPGPQSLSRATRLVLLMELDNHHLLDTLSLQKIADLLEIPDLNRSTVMRDLNDLPELRSKVTNARRKFEQALKKPLS
jgi:hypothetical protein